MGWGGAEGGWQAVSTPQPCQGKTALPPVPAGLSIGDCLPLGRGAEPLGAPNYRFRGTDLITALRRVNYP